MNRVKLLKFSSELSPSVLSGEKTITWRLFDDKNVSEGDALQFVDAASGKAFANTVVLRVREKKFGELNERDKRGHETFSSDKRRYEKYSDYYRRPVDAETLVKVIEFQVVKVVN